MTPKQKQALALMRQARAEDPSTDDGVATNDATFYDSEVHVAYVNWRTALSLKRLGLLDYEIVSPDEGWSLRVREGQEPGA